MTETIIFPNDDQKVLIFSSIMHLVISSGSDFGMGIVTLQYFMLLNKIQTG